jgi:hypothetical protein
MPILSKLPDAQIAQIKSDVLASSPGATIQQGMVPAVTSGD